nr:MAG TPA: hypothetical protein [Caudoviricetes sp.]
MREWRACWHAPAGWPDPEHPRPCQSALEGLKQAWGILGRVRC